MVVRDTQSEGRGVDVPTSRVLVGHSFDVRPRPPTWVSNADVGFRTVCRVGWDVGEGTQGSRRRGRSDVGAPFPWEVPLRTRYPHRSESGRVRVARPGAEERSRTS